MMKVSLILVLLLITFSCGGKKKKKTSSGFNLSKFLRKPAKTSAPKTFAPKTTVKPTFKPTVESKSAITVTKDISLWNINSTDQFYKVFGLKPLTQEGGGDGIGSSAGGSSGFSPGCLPMPTMVQIKDWPAHLDHRYKAFPPCVMVNRCSGCCPQFKELSCKPTRSIPRTVNYYLIDFGSTFQSAMSMQLFPAGSSISYTQQTVLVSEDHECACGCSKSIISCNQDFHNWNESYCKCECKPGFQSQDRQCSGSYSFDEDTCSCKCAHRGGDANCPHYMKWNAQECNCVCKTSLRSCKPYQYHNPITCSCVDI